MSVYMRTEDLAPATISAANVKDATAENDDDDWDTDVDAVNDISEKEQRWGSKEIVPDREHFSVAALRENVIQTHETHHVGAHHSSQRHEYGEQN
eukprot:CAMPEP_0117047498 /NCGR_PEP_ID=MMETSP0472-20121206/32825_1 /TAXON_ID=693140 ORGANISM="Tiarina fusus, Strain LIS" /NCGR_SAMPLE_ID=MMETSP0472 /ASSEMBLY_ACC=CAM_ASM_000603 /LENGTH=94 /DNA_ID=CAMNT_0004760221 /DNA_START=13 /DNA_END=297 /DNA_ORIENTATION=+